MYAIYTNSSRTTIRWFSCKNKWESEIKHKWPTAKHSFLSSTTWELISSRLLHNEWYATSYAFTIAYLSSTVRSLVNFIFLNRWSNLQREYFWLSDRCDTVEGSFLVLSRVKMVLTFYCWIISSMEQWMSRVQQRRFWPHQYWREIDIFLKRYTLLMTRC